jgi:hypothetical protein
MLTLLSSLRHRIRRLAAPIAAAALLVAPAVAAPPPGTGTIRGLVVDRTTRQPIAQATVNVVGTTLGAMTGDDGRYAIADVPEGTQRVRAWRLDYPAQVLADIAVTGGRGTQADFELEIEAVKAQEVEVHAQGFARAPDVPTTSYQLSYEEIRRSPGAIGDVLRLIQSLPGMAMANDQRNDLIARGGSPNENLTLVDNVEVPTLNHFASQGSSGGPISMLDNELVRDATFLAGGFPAEYGGRLSSVLDVRLREGDRERFRAQADVSFAGAGMSSEGPLGKKGSWIGSVRQSYLDLLATSFGLVAVPHTTDWQWKGAYDVSTSDKFWLVAIGGRDDIHIKPEANKPSDPNTVEVIMSGWRQVTGANWQHLWGTRGWGTLGVSDAVGHYVTDAYAEEIDGALAYRNRSTEGETTVKYDAAYRAGRLGDFKLGAQAKRIREDLEMLQPHGMLNPYSSDTTRVNATNFVQAGSTWSYAAHLQGTWHFGHTSDLTLGALAERFGVLDATTLSPRAGLATHLTPWLDLNLSYGRYRQAPTLALVEADPVNRDLAPMRADHYVAGLQYLPRPDLRVTLEAYDKEYADYPVSTQYPTLSIANTGDEYGVYGLLMPYTSIGRGRARGIEFYLQKKLTTSWYGQVSYTLSRTEHRAADGVLRRGAYDAPSTANVIAGWRPADRWELSTKASYAVGRPYTPPLQPVSSLQNRYVYDLSRVNGVRAKDYQRVDVRVDRHTRLHGRDYTWFFEAQNVFDRRNVFQYVWNTKTSSLSAVDQIHFFPVGGCTLKF